MEIIRGRAEARGRGRCDGEHVEVQPEKGGDGQFSMKWYDWSNIYAHVVRLNDDDGEVQSKKGQFSMARYDW